MAKKRGVSGLPKTYHEGANDERSAVLAKVRRELKKQNLPAMQGWVDGRALVAWLLTRNERYDKRPGGLKR